MTEPLKPLTKDEAERLWKFCSGQEPFVGDRIYEGIDIHFVDACRAIAKEDHVVLDREWKLPCDVRLPNGMTIGKGVHLHTLLVALQRRETLYADYPQMLKFADRAERRCAAAPDLLLRISEIVENAGSAPESGEAVTKTGIVLQAGRNVRDGKEHDELHAPCGCAFHPEPWPHWHPCEWHAEQKIVVPADDRQETRELFERTFATIAPPRAYEGFRDGIYPMPWTQERWVVWTSALESRGNK